MPRDLPTEALVRNGVRAAAVASAGFAAIRAGGWANGPFPLPAMLAFTPYALVGAVGLAAAAGVRGDRAAAAGAAGAAAVLAGAIVPRAVGRTQPAASGPRLVLTSANLLYGAAEAAALEEIIARRAPDVVALQELTPEGIAQLEAAGIFAHVPHASLGPGAFADDVGVAARWPVVDLDLGLPTVFKAVAVDVPDYGAVPVISVHPHPPGRPDVQRKWQGWLGQIPAPTGALAGGIVAGDFNATLDNPELRRLLAAGWRDAARELGAGLRPTWHGLPGARLTLDHVLVPPGAAVESYEIDPLPGSDHRAVTVTLRLPPRARGSRAN